MTPKQRPVKLTSTVLLPLLCFAVERRVKNKVCLLLTKLMLSEDGRRASHLCDGGR